MAGGVGMAYALRFLPAAALEKVECPLWVRSGCSDRGRRGCAALLLRSLATGQFLPLARHIVRPLERLLHFEICRMLKGSILALPDIQAFAP